MKRLIFSLGILISLCLQYTVSAQNVTFSFPALPEKEVQAYFFQGSKLDSLTVRLDKSGNGNVRFPEGYKGFVQTVVNRSGLVEFIAGENQLRIESEVAVPSRENVKFPGSQENTFYYDLLQRKQKNIQLKAWLSAGIEMYPDNKNMTKALQSELAKAEKETGKIQQDISSSSLYAARFIEIMDFAEELFQAENKQDKNKISYVKEYVQNKMNWEALYTSGQFWTMVHNYYLSMYNKEDQNRPLEETQQLYAISVLSLIQKVEEPIRSAMFISIMNECEAFSWETAKQMIIFYVINNNLNLDFSKPAISRAFQGYEARAGENSLPISGIDNLNNSLIVFYESGCGSCQIEMKKLIENYNTIQNKGIRIISVSADLSETVNEFYSKDFPWADKLCDYQGFQGKAFSDYGIRATPTFFVIDNQGKIATRCARLQDTKLLD